MNQNGIRQVEVFYSSQRRLHHAIDEYSIHLFASNQIWNLAQMVQADLRLVYRPKYSLFL